MIEFLAALSALPNVHPALVHFPIALLPVAVLMDLAGLLIRAHRVWLGRAATTLYALAGIGAGLALWAGNRAADSLMNLTPGQLVAVGEHHDAALRATWLVGIAAILRLIIEVWSAPERWMVPLRLVFLPLAVVAVALVAVAADHGGGLVFEYGVAVSPVASQAPAREAPPPDTQQTDAVGDTAASHLEIREDGSVSWQPLAGDGPALGTLLTAAPGSTLAAVEWVEPDDPAQIGLPIEVTGRALLLLPGQFGGLQIDAELEVVDFRGRIGLAHHVLSSDEAAYFTVSTTLGEAQLSVDTHGSEEVLAEGTVDLDSSPLRLSAFAAGRHFRGMQDGEVVVHGHHDALPPGGVGLLVDGQGEIRILGLSITSVQD